MTRLMSIAISVLTGVVLVMAALLLPRPPAPSQPDAIPSAFKRFVYKTSLSIADNIPSRERLLAGLRTGLKKTRRSFLTALQRRAEVPETHVAAGWRAIGCGELPAAEKCFRRATSLNPSHIDALEGLAIVLARAGRREEAIPVYKNLLELGSQKREVRFDLAIACMEARQFGQAEQLFKELLDEDETDMKSRYNLATVYHATGKLHDAKDAWQEIARLRPDFIGAREKLGEVLLDLGDAKAAMKEYLHVANLRRDDVDAWRNLAIAADAAGSLGRATVALQKAIELKPDRADIRADMGNLKLRLHRETGEKKFLVEAVAAWRESLKLDKDQPDIRKKLETYELVIADEPKP